MSNKLKRALSFVLSVMVSNAYAEGPVQLDLFTQEFPPLQVNVDNQAEGYAYKFVEEVIVDASVSVPMEIKGVYFAPWKRAIKNTQERSNTLLFSISRTPEREDLYQWIGAVSPYEVAVYRTLDGPDIIPSSIHDLASYRFAAQAASSFEEIIKSEGFTQIIPVNQGKEAIRLLHAGRVDFAPLVTASFPYRMEQYGYHPNEFVEVVKVDSLCKQLWLVTGKKTSPDVVAALRSSLNNLKNSGRLEELIAEHHPLSEVMLRYRSLQ